MYSEDEEGFVYDQTGYTIKNVKAEDLDVEAIPVDVGGEFCNSCYQSYHVKDFFALQCGHRFCVNCNRENLQVNINNGKAMVLPCM